MRVRRKWAWLIFGPLPMELSLGLFFGNQGQIGQPLSEDISLLKCSSRSKQKILGLKDKVLCFAIKSSIDKIHSFFLRCIIECIRTRILRLQ